MTTYMIERLYRDSSRRDLIAQELTLDEAQTHCRDESTSSSTCSDAVGIQRTEDLGPWFDSYSEE